MYYLRNKFNPKRKDLYLKTMQRDFDERRSRRATQMNNIQYLWIRVALLKI